MSIISDFFFFFQKNSTKDVNHFTLPALEHDTFHICFTQLDLQHLREANSKVQSPHSSSLSHCAPTDVTNMFLYVQHTDQLFWFNIYEST